MSLSSSPIGPSETQNLEKIVLYIPTVFSQKGLPKNDVEYRRKILNEEDGNVVLLADAHKSSLHYFMCRIQIDPSNKECYYAQKLNFDNVLIKNILWYNDLDSLFVGVGVGIRKEFALRK